MFFQICGRVVNQDNILIIVPGYIAMMIVDLEHFVDEKSPEYWQWNHPMNAAFAIHLRTGERLIVAAIRHDGEYERLEKWWKEIKEQTTAFGPYHYVPQAEPTDEEKREMELARLKKELDF